MTASVSISSVPAVIDALFAHAEAVCADVEGAVPYDGPGRVTSGQKYLAVGYAGTHAQTASAGQQQIADLAGSRDLERYAIACEASAWAGNGAFKPLRDAAVALVDGLAARIGADRRLGGACMHARLAVVDYTAVMTNKGPTVTVPFHVQIEAMRRNS